MTLAFINLPTSEARESNAFYVFENVRERSVPIDHTAARVVIQKPTIHYNHSKRIPSWMSKHPVLSSIAKHISNDHQYLDEPFAALADFKVIRKKARKPTVHDALRKIPSSPDKVLSASIAGTLMHFFEAWKPDEKCFDQCSSECIDFHGLSQIMVRLTPERTSLDRRKKPMPWQSAGLVFALGASRTQCSALLLRCYR